MFKQLDELKNKLDQYRPLPKEMVANLRESLLLNWTYHSNAIEGNTLTLQETKVALEGITIGGKALREHFEAINHRDAIIYVEELVKQSELLSEWHIKQLHSLVLRNIDADNAGKYRSINVLIAGAEHTPSDSILVPEQMQSMMDWYQNEAQELHPVERAARLHSELVKIHPFVDGNGRTARLIMNLSLMQSGFPAVLIKVEQRLAYYQALDKAHTQNNYQDFINLIAESVKQSFEPYWFALGIN